MTRSSRGLAGIGESLMAETLGRPTDTTYRHPYASDGRLLGAALRLAGRRGRDVPDAVAVDRLARQLGLDLAAAGQLGQRLGDDAPRVDLEVPAQRRPRVRQPEAV